MMGLSEMATAKAQVTWGNQSSDKLRQWDITKKYEDQVWFVTKAKKWYIKTYSDW
jgi:hypothetical protein